MSTISILGAIGSLFYTQFFVTPDYPTQDCTGKTFIVTGANTGYNSLALKPTKRSHTEY